ncbi:uncharacterized protein LOC131997276 [Stomoxys calcitrans]|uniref:uncharacterized protein LOC131997276 n=1 Tax=Stomoxys calcitrans TaxID=35570 RepID=UPI0027E27E8E|nr:uncharacterized protein LOC131997276 [Stomoxys calcitrans]
MFSLVKFEKDDYYVVNTKCIDFITKQSCVAKYRGCKYSATFIEKNDDKLYLENIKSKKNAETANHGDLQRDVGIEDPSIESPATKQIFLNTKRSQNFCLVLFENDDFYILDSKKVKITEGNQCIAKYKGCCYSATFIAENELPQILKIDVIVPPYENDQTLIQNSSNRDLDATFSVDISSIKEWTSNKCTENQKSSELEINEDATIPLNTTYNINGSAAEPLQIVNKSLTKIGNESTAKTISTVGETIVSEYEPSSLLLDSNPLETLTEPTKPIQDPVKLNKLLLKNPNRKTKQHFCIFCNKLQSKLARHFFLKHKSEKQIKRAMAMPKKCSERLQILETLRKKGDFIHNTNQSKNSGILITTRQKLKSGETPDDYTCCKKCKGFFKIVNIRKHLKKCCGPGNKGNRKNLIEGRQLTQYIHPAASDLLKLEIFPVLNNDNLVKEIRYDELIIKFGNKLAEKLVPQHQHDQVRANMRLLGRFVIEMKKISPDVKELKDIYKPYLYDNAVLALRNTAKWNMHTGFATPSVASSLSTLIKKCGHTQKSEFVKCQNSDLKDQLNDFMTLWEEDTPIQINRRAILDQQKLKRLKQITLPSKNDISKMTTYLRTKMRSALKALSTKFKYYEWKTLVQTSLVYIQMFNRRRAGETERLLVENYKLKTSICDSDMTEDLTETISKEAMDYAKKFVRVCLTGKLDRGVAVLLDDLCQNSIETILKYRKKAGIKKNPYIFSRKVKSNLQKKYYRACPLMRKFATECGAEMPNTLRGTVLRKHIATHTSLLNIGESSVETLANFLGHHKDIHKSHYRLPVPVAEITTVSKLLESAAGYDQDEHDNDEHEEIHIDNQDDESDNESVANAVSVGSSDGDSDGDSDGETKDETMSNAINKSDSDSDNDFEKQESNQKRNSSSFGKASRSRWSIHEIMDMEEEFGEIDLLENLPSLQACQSAINKYTSLQHRTPAQLKSWIHNKLKKNRRN